MTWNDEIVEEVRRVRNEHAARFDYDISAICADIRLKQAMDGRKVISRDKNEKRETKSDLPKAS
jgi:hypothetical protein